MMMKRLKIAHITTIDSSLYGLLLNQLKSIQASGYEVVGISTPGQYVPALEMAGIRHIPLPMTRRISPMADLVALWRLYRLMRREQFTIVHTHTPKPSLLGQLAARFAGVPVIVNTVHGYYFHDYMHPLVRRFFICMEKIGARCSHLILSQNRDDLETAIQERICAPDKISYLGNGIDLNRFDPGQVTASAVAKNRAKLGFAPDTPVVGFVGRLASKRKGFLEFMASSRRLAERRPDVRFLIVGAPDVGKADAVGPQIAKKYGIADKCLFLGELPNSELPVLYKIIDVLVLPSLFEGIPRVVIEASAMGVPVVATDVKGNREAVEDGRNGFLVPLGDVNALAETVHRVLSDRKMSVQMGAQAQQLAQERFDEQIVFRKVLAAYKQLLQNTGLPTPEPQTSVKGVIY